MKAVFLFFSVLAVTTLASPAMEVIEDEKTDGCTTLAGRWQGNYQYGGYDLTYFAQRKRKFKTNISDSTCGICTHEGVALTFTDVGNNADFFVHQDFHEGCDCANDACWGCQLAEKDFIASCKDSKVTMEGYSGLTSSTQLVLIKDDQSHSQRYSMAK